MQPMTYTEFALVEFHGVGCRLPAAESLVGLQIDNDIIRISTLQTGMTGPWLRANVRAASGNRLLSLPAGH